MTWLPSVSNMRSEDDRFSMVTGCNCLGECQINIPCNRIYNLVFSNGKNCQVHEKVLEMRM